ncbi:MAG TPA: LytTR family DNA-binding domain-containing protein [Steroidobacteraceae bacterium]|jgi:two-component system LytT family response regulator|nr:LytTR family DNA-binding domain-containing protein [Steroidobacteraceae bacterium]
MTLATLIVDDEPMARKRLQRLLKTDPDVRLLPPCADGRSAVAAIEERRPDVVFLDVQMPEMNGFEVLAAVGVKQMPAVIFVTAYDKFALQAFEAQALDYLLKPFGVERVHTALERARVFLAGSQRGIEKKLTGLLRATSGVRESPCVLVKKRDRVLVLRPDEIDHVEAFGDYVRLHVGQEVHLLRATLAEMEQKLEPEGFARIHRSRLVNWKRVREFVADRERDPVVVLKNGTRLAASHGCLKDLEKRLGARG